MTNENEQSQSLKAGDLTPPPTRCLNCGFLESDHGMISASANVLDCPTVTGKTWTPPEHPYITGRYLVASDALEFAVELNAREVLDAVLTMFNVDGLRMNAQVRGKVQACITITHVNFGNPNHLAPTPAPGVQSSSDEK